MKVEALGDRAYLLRELPHQAHRCAEWLNAHPPPGLIEAIASYDTVGLYTDESFVPDDLTLPDQLPDGENRSHTIPVCYAMGPDLSEASAQLGMSEEALSAAHTSAEYLCYAVGFCPGFAYLGDLPESIRGIPRRASPRVSVEPGSVGIVGKQTAVYPLRTPGGWALIGKTPLTLVDVADGYFPLSAGDRVRFHAIGEGDYRALLGERL